MAVEETEFTQVFRGYDKDEVDRSINALRREIITANNATGELQKENKRLLTRIDELTGELEEVGSPTFSGLGTKLENTLRRDPTLAFKLIRYINSAAFGLSVEISSFRHAIMMLGYTRLKRWLALLLATASKDANLKPVMFAAVRRGLMMEELVRSSGDDEMRNEMFICGVFSLLDRMFKQPFPELLKTIPVPERVYQALAENGGPYKPYFKLVQAVEGDSLDAIRDASDNLMMGSAEINRALLKSLAAAATLE